MYRLPFLNHRVRHPFFTSRPQNKIEAAVVLSHLSNHNYLRRIKALLFTLVRGFEFELALSAEDVVRMTTIVGRPGIASNPAAGPQLPLLIRQANMD